MSEQRASAAELNLRLTQRRRPHAKRLVLRLAGLRFYSVFVSFIELLAFDCVGVVVAVAVAVVAVAGFACSLAVALLFYCRQFG